MAYRTWKSVQRLSLGVLRKIDYLSIFNLLISKFKKITPSLFLTRCALSNDVSHLTIGTAVSPGRVQTDIQTGAIYKWMRLLEVNKSSGGPNLNQILTLQFEGFRRKFDRPSGNRSSSALSSFSCT